jgi:hypothetical protein
MMYRIQLEDTTSPRGQRKVSVGIATPQGQDLVKSFNFNDKSVLGSILHKPYSVDTATGVITIADFTPIFDVEAVAGANHVKFAGAFASVNFETGESEIQYTNEENLPIDETVTQITLTPVAVPTVVGTHFFLLEVLYFQEVNGTQYSLNNGLFNAFSIIDLDTP